MCLGSHAARGDYGGCVSARVSRLGLHGVRGGRVAVARLASMRVVVWLGSHDARAAGGAAGAS